MFPWLILCLREIIFTFEILQFLKMFSNAQPGSKIMPFFIIGKRHIVYIYIYTHNLILLKKNSVIIEFHNYQQK